MSRSLGKDDVTQRLRGKAALITGGSSGIGLATARRFVEAGARVAITGTDAGRLALAERELAGCGAGEVLTIVADAGDVDAQAMTAQTVGAAFGRIDILFANAGISRFCPLEALDEAAFDRMIGINLKGPLFLARALLPWFANPASIILNGSINAHRAMPNATLYSATKGAIITLARTLSAELMGRGIRANVISPGPTDTPIMDKLGLSPAQLAGVKASVIGRIPAGRLGDPDEIAATALYLASDESRFTVGSEIVVDGGMSIV
jgi:NAD(P)-dependent dehydrogenase (short-subunit alcohol dehydrogenase family)